VHLAAARLAHRFLVSVRDSNSVGEAEEGGLEKAIRNNEKAAFS